MLKLICSKFKKITPATTLSTKKFPKKNREPFYQKKDFKS